MLSLIRNFRFLTKKILSNDSIPSNEPSMLFDITCSISSKIGWFYQLLAKKSWVEEIYVRLTAEVINRPHLCLEWIAIDVRGLRKTIFSRNQTLPAS